MSESDCEESEDEEDIVGLVNGASVKKIEQLSLVQKEDNNAQDDIQVGPGPEDEPGEENDPELDKRLSKQRQRAIQEARGRRKVITSRNTYKDKGGRSSNNSKIQKQLSS
ncbi:Unknown protein [Striga hermonthica]|uniref:Uncharacterized protein n=1 Tax=Striga hermonthica TaxID=68872 RepID=A0A9N7MX45_STRHE|nr:Unknown protein [Striga hermonthica]